MSTCNHLLVGGTPVEAHLIGGKSYAQARQLAEGCGGLVYWDSQATQAVVVPALAPDWHSFSLLVDAGSRWATEYQMHQARLDYIWSSALRRRVDPRLMVAILLHEGTGSFNTNPSNSSQYNGHGPDADWITDTNRAVSHVAGKLAYYGQALAAGFAQAAATLGYEGTPIQYVGWPGPIWQHNPSWGCYAQHADWWQGVSGFFVELGGQIRSLTDYWQVGPVPTPPVKLRCLAVTNRPDLCSNLSGTVGRPGVITVPD